MKTLQNDGLVSGERKIYMAGKLFSVADQEQRKREYFKLKKANQEEGLDIEIYSPLFAPINDKSKLPTAKDIFDLDEYYLMNSEISFFDLTDADPGVLMELGMIILLKRKIYVYLSDIRINTAGEYDGVYVPYGYNQFVVGGVEKYAGKIYASFDEALEAYREDMSLIID